MYEVHTTRLLLVRHAESVANAERRVQGSGDDPLSPHGEHQARQLALWLQNNGIRADVLFSSPLRRARQTAEAISVALGLEIQIRPGLREIGLGSLEGASEDTWATTVTDGRATTPIEGAEEPRDFVERALGTLHGLLAAYEGNTIMVVTHGGVISAALAHWLERNVTRWTIYAATRNTAVSELVFGERIELLRYNDIVHLNGTVTVP